MQQPRGAAVQAGREREVAAAAGTSGMRHAAPSLARRQQLRPLQPIHATLLLTHYHWDHIHGFPFFGPAFVPGNRLVIYGEPRNSRGVREILEGQMAMPYFPVPLDAMRADFDFSAASRSCSAFSASALSRGRVSWSMPELEIGSTAGLLAPGAGDC